MLYLLNSTEIQRKLEQAQFQALFNSAANRLK